MYFILGFLIGVLVAVVASWLVWRNNKARFNQVSENLEKAICLLKKNNIDCSSCDGGNCN